MTLYMKYQEEREAGRQEGRQEGREEERRGIALNMLAMGMDENTVAEAARVPVETIRRWAVESAS